MVQTKLIAFIDDASRVIVHGEFFVNETIDCLVTALKAAFCKRGIPKQLYVDNGHIYCSKEIILICGRVGCILRLTPLRDGASKVHTYGNTIKILCEAFKTDYSGSHFKCERRVINEALSLYNQGKTIIGIIDDAHLMSMTILRKLRLMFEDFPKNHNLILAGEIILLQNMALTVNQDITSRVTYSTILKKLNPDDMQAFIERELTTCGLPHNVFTENTPWP